MQYYQNGIGLISSSAIGLSLKANILLDNFVVNKNAHTSKYFILKKL